MAALKNLIKVTQIRFPLQEFLNSSAVRKRVDIRTSEREIWNSEQLEEMLKHPKQHTDWLKAVYCTNSTDHYVSHMLKQPPTPAEMTETEPTSKTKIRLNTLWLTARHRGFGCLWKTGTHRCLIAHSLWYRMFPASYMSDLDLSPVGFYSTLTLMLPWPKKKQKLLLNW